MGSEFNESSCDQITIEENLKSPTKLEKMFRETPTQFKRWFAEAEKQFPASETVQVWSARIHYATPRPEHSRSGYEYRLAIALILSFVVFMVLKLPIVLDMDWRDTEWFYSRFAPLTIVGSIITYFMLSAKQWTTQTKISIVAFISCFLIALAYPSREFDNRMATSNDIPDSVIMALIYIPFFLISILGSNFLGDKWRDATSRLHFLRYIGEMLIYAVLLLIGGGILTGMTAALFAFLDFDLEWYYENIVLLGVIASPLIATYVYDVVLNRDSKIATVIANIFSPLFLITVVFYLLALIVSGSNPFVDRDFLITFNALLLIVWGITVFSISGKANGHSSKLSDSINILLILVTLVINGIALAAILYRTFEMGITVNRTVVTGSNIIIFVHLIRIVSSYIRTFNSDDDSSEIIESIANYLPVYTIWSVIVIVVIPLLFRYQ